MKNYSILVLCIILTTFGCKKDPLQLESDVALPLAYTHLQLQTILPDSIYTLEGEHLTLSYEDTAQLFDLKDFLILPDTTMKDTVRLSSNLPLSFAPGTVLTNIIRNVQLPLKDALIKRIEVESGALIVKITNFLPQPLRIDYAFNNATFSNGSPVYLQQLIPANGFSSEAITINQVNFDLTDGGFNFNRINTNTSAKIDASATGSVTVNPNQPLVEAEVKFKELVPKYAEGYFGQQFIEKEGTIAVDVFKTIQSGFINFEDISIDINILNSIGVDAQVEVKELKAMNTQTGQSINLLHPNIGGTTNITRGSKNGNHPQATTTSLKFNASNSNISSFVSVLPNQIYYKIKAKTNPNGNTSQYNDFIYNTSALKAHLKVRVPLKFKAQNLTFIDTLAVNDSISIKGIQANGQLHLLAQNNIPHQFKIELEALDVNYQPLKTLIPLAFIEQGSLNAPHKTWIHIPLTNSDVPILERTHFFKVKAVIHSPNTSTSSWNSAYDLLIKLSYTGILSNFE